MNVKKIMCAIDFSEHSEAALGYATSLARDSDAELHLVHAYEEPYGFAEAGIAAAAIPPVDLAPEREKFEAVVPTDSTVRFQRKFIVGHPSDVLIDYAKDEHMDLIVMGTHGRTGLERLLMGSVAEVVVRRASCPVLTIKQPANFTHPQGG